MYRESLGLKGGLEKPLHEVVKVQPWFPKRLQDSRDARTMGFLLKKKGIYTENNWPKRKDVCATGTRVGGMGLEMYYY